MKIRILILVALLVVVIAFLWQRERRPDVSAVVTQVRQLNQLATVRYTVQKIVDLEEQKQPVGSERILLIMQATVEAGVDLAGLRPDQVQNRAGAVIFHLPPAQILHVFVDDKDTRVWDRQKTWWTPWVPYSLDLEQRARLQGLDSVKQAALDMGILKDAERNAESSLRGLLGLAGVKTMVIIPAGLS